MCVWFHWTTSHFARCKGEKWESLIQLAESQVIHSKTRMHRSLNLIFSPSWALPLLPAAPTTCIPTRWCKGSSIRDGEFRNMVWVLLFISVSAGWGVLHLLKRPREIWSRELVLNTIQRSPWNTKQHPAAEKNSLIRKDFELWTKKLDNRSTGSWAFDRISPYLLIHFFKKQN